MIVAAIIVLCATALALQHQWFAHQAGQRLAAQQTDAQQAEIKELKAKVDALTLRAGFTRQ
jgi:hypothetical protein